VILLTQSTLSAARGAGQVGDDDARRRLIGELILACATGDRLAFRRLYELSSSKVFGVLVAMLRDRETAADVAQEVYVSVWRNAGSFRPEAGSGLAWLMAITRNRAVDRLRAGRARGLSAPIDDFPGLAADLPPAEGAVDVLALRRALDTLRPEVRRTILLVFFRGYTHEEVARAMDVPLGTSKTWVRRGLIALRKALE
jgi:RNA polymerase sigma-70 factor (ECF subfamily)